MAEVFLQEQLKRIREYERTDVARDEQRGRAIE
jgi:hypothetical protein